MNSQVKARKGKLERISWEPISQKKSIDLKSIVGSGKEMKQSSYPSLQGSYSLLVP